MQTKDPRKRLGAFIKLVREAAGFDGQKPFADKLGISPAYVSKLESGEATPSPELLLDLVKQFGADEKTARRLLRAVSEAADDERWQRAAVRIGVAAP